MKVAIFYDWINQWGGAEKVLLSLIRTFPNAPVYTLVYDRNKTTWLPSNTKVIPSFIDKLPGSKNNPIIYTPIYDMALELFDFSEYDIVISTTSTIGHCLITNPNTIFICYFHNINRYLYQTPIKFRFLKPLLKIYEKIDHIYSCRPDSVFCNSSTVASRIRHQYQLNPLIINPGVDVDYFKPNGLPPKNYFLYVGRLVPHKSIDIIIKVFNQNHQKLIIIGTGRQEAHLKKLSSLNKNIFFAGKVDDSNLLKYYQNCTALICPQLEDFGLTSIEAQACGRPVIAYGHGGNTETVVNGKTGIFFNEQTVDSLSNAIEQFTKASFVTSYCRSNAVKFSEKSFMLNFIQAVNHLWKKHQTTLS